MRLSPRQHHYLQALGIDVYKIRNTEHTGPGRQGTDLKSVPASTPAAGVIEQDNAVSAGGIAPQTENGDVAGWEELQRKVAECRLCGLYEGRTQTVFGVGDVNADWMLIGEAPGAEEDRRGEPFVGRAGKLLDAMLQAVGFAREQVFIANILKCRPPKNRDPRPEEVVACSNYLEQQINTVKPKIILALGRVAAQNLLKTETPIGKMRGKRYHYGDPPVPVVVTYHPAYLLRSPREKKKSWQDLRMAMTIYKEQT
ncbi:MAG: uracil-DNA glycosylase [Gammaproteobacteria bacterium]|nr:uracil-DNA glycosylase [Gammaproteobacteria bacterium]